MSTRHRVGVQLSNLMETAANECKCTGLSIGFSVANSYLRMAAQRAIDNHDEPMVAIFSKIGVITGVDNADAILDEYEASLDLKKGAQHG